MGYKPRGDFILVDNLVKNESTTFFTIFIPYQTYWCICWGQINDFFGKIRKTVHFGAIFTVQAFEPRASSSLTYANTDHITTRGKPNKTAVAIQVI